MRFFHFHFSVSLVPAHSRPVFSGPQTLVGLLNRASARLFRLAIVLPDAFLDPQRPALPLRTFPTDQQAARHAGRCESIRLGLAPIY